VTCLDEDEITDLLAGRLGLNAARVEEHLAACALCARLLGAANVTLAEAVRGPLTPRTTTFFAATGADPLEGVPFDQQRSARALQPGSVLNDTYSVQRLLGRGGMGEVYEVHHTRLSGRYAVKVLRAEISDDRELLSRFRREAEITSALRHPNIIQVFDFDRTAEGCVYLAMECLEGLDLGRLLRQERQLPLDRVMRFAAQMASALTAAHRRGVVHRDLKPENVFIIRDEDEVDERVKLMDFGLSKWSGTTLESSLPLSRGQALIGTPRYMAPEQALGRNHEVAAATDQFAFAAIVYEMLAGVPAFPAETLPQLLHAIVYEAPTDLRGLRPNLPAALGAAIEKALAKTPQDRFASVQDFHRALLEAVTRGGQHTGPNPGRRHRRRKILGGAAVVAAGLALAAWGGLGGRPVSRGVAVMRSAAGNVAAPAPSAPLGAPVIASPPATADAALPPAAAPPVQSPDVRPVPKRFASPRRPRTATAPPATAAPPPEADGGAALPGGRAPADSDHPPVPDAGARKNRPLQLIETL
jgi:tRNA A-37 threonylcarbamoyl transferase component Bud32